MDKTVDTAEISNSTSVVTQSVAGNDAAIGYISLGSLDDTVKAVKVDGVEATVDNIKSGDYKIQETVQHRNKRRSKRTSGWTSSSSS